MGKGKHKLIKEKVFDDGEYLEPMAPGSGFCAGCPDHEGCMSGYPCSMVKRLDKEFRRG